MSKPAQLHQLERGVRFIWIVVALLGACALYLMFMLINGRNFLDQFGFAIFALVFSLLAWVIHISAVMTKKGIAALNTMRPTSVEVTIKATQLESTIEYVAQLEWLRARLELPLGAQHEFLKPLLHQPTFMLAYPDAQTGLPAILETDEAYLWLKAPPRRA